MRIRKLAPAGLAVGALALLLSFTPAKAATEFTGSIAFGHPTSSYANAGYDRDTHACEEKLNDDGTPNYDGYDGVWIDLRGKVTPGQPAVLVPSATLDAEVKYFALLDENEDGEMECTYIPYDDMAAVFVGEPENGSVPAGAQFALVYGWFGSGDFTLKIG